MLSLERSPAARMPRCRNWCLHIWYYIGTFRFVQDIFSGRFNHRVSLLPHQSDQRLELGIGCGKFRGDAVSSELGTGDVGGVAGTAHGGGF